MCFRKAKQSVMENKLKVVQLQKSRVQKFGHLLLFPKQSNLYCKTIGKTDKKVAQQLQKSKVEIFEFIFTFQKQNNLNWKTKESGGVPTGKKSRQIFYREAFQETRHDMYLMGKNNTPKSCDFANIVVCRTQKNVGHLNG